MQTIIKVSQINKISCSLHQKNKKIVLVGGCFDLVHLGHLIFLQKAKSVGDILIVLLESDQTIRRLKGDNRPINSQTNRAKFLSFLNFVDFIVLLPELKTDKQYQDLINQIKPNVIAITSGDPNLQLKTNTIKSTSAKIVAVTKKIPQQSTSLIIKKL